MTPAITSFRMADLMRSLEIEFMPIARDKGLDLRFVACSLPVESDRSLLRRLLQNFISNAIKYTPRGRVLIGCRRRGDALEISIFDTGVGIPEDKLPLVFERFYRADPSRADGGAGLGLSIAATIVQQHRGAIGVQPTPGGGATFWIELQGTDLDPEQQVEPDQLRALTRSDGSPNGADPQD